MSLKQDLVLEGLFAPDTGEDGVASVEVLPTFRQWFPWNLEWSCESAYLIRCVVGQCPSTHFLCVWMLYADGSCLRNGQASLNWAVSSVVLPAGSEPRFGFRPSSL